MTYASPSAQADLPHCRVDVCMSGVTPTASVSVDPLQPMLRTVTRHQILKIVRGRNPLGLSSPEKVLCYRISVVAKRNLEVDQHQLRQTHAWQQYFDRSIETMEISIVASPLIGLMLFHQWQEFLRSPSFRLKVIVIRCRSASVHHLHR